MAEDYTTLALVKESINEPTGRDAYITEKIASASRSIDRHCGRRFYLDAAAGARVLSPRRNTLPDCDGERLFVPDIGSSTGLVVEVGRDPSWTDITDSVELEPTDALDRDPAEAVTSLLYEDGAFSRQRRVRVTARWGWPEVPQTIQEAALIQAIRLYKRKDSPEGVLGSSEWGTVRVSRLDPDVAKLVESYVLPGNA